MAKRDFQCKDYTPEEEIARTPGGATLWRAFSASENAGRGRRDLVLQAPRALAEDVNVVDQLRDRLERTAGISHPGLFSTVTSVAGKGGLYVASEWAPSAPLSALTAHKWPAPAALYLAAEIAKTLAFLQAAVDPLTGKPLGLFHGQVRPENIFLTFAGQVKLLSLGMAELETAALHPADGYARSFANYASPEVAARREIDGRTDFFSLGATLWELLAARPLFPPCDREEWLRMLIEKTPPPPSQSNPEIPAEVDAIVAKLLDRDLFLRYELGEKIAQDLGAVLKFRFPDFQTGDFLNACAKPLEPFRERYRRSLEAGSAETRILDEAETKVLDDAETKILAQDSEVTTEISHETVADASLYVQKTSSLRISPVIVPTPAFTHDEPEEPASFWESVPIYGTIVTFCLISMVVLGQQIYKRSQASRTPAHATAKTGRGTLHFVSHESDYAVEVNGSRVDVFLNEADVPADREIVVRATKPGYDTIEITTRLISGETLELPLDFKKSEN